MTFNTTRIEFLVLKDMLMALKSLDTRRQNKREGHNVCPNYIKEVHNTHLNFPRRDI